MLAPVLARLDSIPGVSSSRVESSGCFFWIALAEGANPSRVTDLALGVLGASARTLPAADAVIQVERQIHGDPWLGADEVMALSFMEARMLSVRLAGQVARLAGVSPAEVEAIAEAIRIELFAAMERAHAEGGRSSSGWIHREWPAIAEAVAKRCPVTLQGERRRRIAELLPGLLTP